MARQRVGLVLKPGNVWVIEFAVEDSTDIEVQLQTCLLRGWVEVLHTDVPSGRLREDPQTSFTVSDLQSKQIYRLTEGGWAAINRAHAWTLVNTVLAISGIALAAMQLM
jgi:hypothetical protein